MSVALSSHGALGTWTRSVDRFIALTRFARDRLVAAGLSPERIAVKPNGLSSDPEQVRCGGRHALFVGRLSPEKGVDVALKAWSGPNVPPIALKIVGDGPLSREVGEAAATTDMIQPEGACDASRVASLMREALCLVLPSRWLEGLPMTLVEAFSVGLPVVTSDLGALSSLVDHGRTGLLVPPNDPSALAGAVTSLAMDRGRCRAMGESARGAYESHYSADRLYDGLLRVYRDAVAERHGEAVG